jgi:hypothetical protein
MTQGWTEFRLEAFGEPYMVWHDGPDFDAFQRRAIADPVTVEAVLREGLAANDPLAAQSIAEADFDDAIEERMIPLLTEAVGRTNDTFRVSVAKALIRVTSSEQWSSSIVEVLVHAAFWSDRLDAAMALGHLTPTVELIAALMKGAQDPDYLVRYHSSNSLLRYAGRSEDISALPEEFALLTAENEPASWALVASGLAGAASARLALPR